MPREPHRQGDWQAIGRECALVRDLIGSGVTALGRANYADKKGAYYTAFFALSVGIERLSKLIFVADRIIQTSTVPTDRELRDHGHGLVGLLDASERIQKRYNMRPGFPRPLDSIATAVVNCLNSFSDARRGRYANFQALYSPILETEFEPIRQWWSEVAERILDKHYRGKAIERRVKQNAEIAEALIGQFSVVRFTAETGDAIEDVRAASERTGQTPVVQRYGRYYTLQTVRWLASVFAQLCRDGAYDRHIELLFGPWEHFYS
jgi:hypothetical protein